MEQQLPQQTKKENKFYSRTLMMVSIPKKMEVLLQKLIDNFVNVSCKESSMFMQLVEKSKTQILQMTGLVVHLKLLSIVLLTAVKCLSAAIH